MAARRQQQTISTPGNSGAWYLELVGVEVPDELRYPNGQTQVGQLWDPTGGADILDGWAPEALDATVTGTRRFRWTVVVLLVALGLVAVAALLVLPALAEGRANGLIGDYRQGLLELNADLAPAQLVLKQATDPSAKSPDLGTAARTLSDLEQSSGRVGEMGSTPLPSTLPLVPRSPLEDLEPVRVRMVEVGATANDIAGRIETITEYRVTIEGVLDLPTLPAVADTDTIDGLGLQLAAVRAETAVALASLPDDPVLAAHKAMIRQAQDRIGPWQSEYLDALRSGDRELAAELVNEMADLRRDLDTEFGNAQAELRADIDASLVTLAEQIDATLVLLPR